MSATTFIHHDGALGDLLLSLPCIHAIREELGPLHLAGRHDVVQLLRKCGVVDEVSSADSGMFASLFLDRCDERVCEFLSRFERAFVFTAREDSIAANSIRHTILQTRMVLTIPPDGARRHVAEFRSDQLAFYNTPGHSPLLAIPEPQKRRAIQFLRESGWDEGRPLVAFHPGSGGKRKCWPLERYLKLGKRMREDLDAFLVIFSGPAEDAHAKETIDDFAKGTAGVVHVRDAPLSDVASVLSVCDLYVGNDSGVTHLASSVGTHAVALFGSTDPALWRPVGRDVRVLSSFPDGSLSEISVDEVYGSAASSLLRSFSICS